MDNFSFFCTVIYLSLIYEPYLCICVSLDCGVTNAHIILYWRWFLPWSALVQLYLSFKSVVRTLFCFVLVHSEYALCMCSHLSYHHGRAWKVVSVRRWPSKDRAAAARLSSPVTGHQPPARKARNQGRHRSLLAARDRMHAQRRWVGESEEAGRTGGADGRPGGMGSGRAS